MHQHASKAWTLEVLGRRNGKDDVVLWSELLHPPFNEVRQKLISYGKKIETGTFELDAGQESITGVQLIPMLTLGDDKPYVDFTRPGYAYKDGMASRFPLVEE